MATGCRASRCCIAGGDAMSFVGRLQNKAVYSILRIHTLWVVFRLRLQGRRIKVGKGTLFSLSARISPGSGVIIMGNHCYIGAGSSVRANGGRVCLSNAVSIGEYCMVHGQGSIFIGRDTLIATHVSLVPSPHKFDQRDVPIRRQGVQKGAIHIGRDCWIGSGARILNDVRIAGGSIIGANAVVTSDTEPYSINGGVPSRKIKVRP